MSYNTKNYTEQAGETTHIGGKLVIDEGGSVEGLPSPSPSPLTLPVVIAETDENGYFGYTFRELWEMYNQNKLIFIFRKDSAESSVPDATDYKTRLLLAVRTHRQLCLLVSVLQTHHPVSIDVKGGSVMDKLLEKVKANLILEHSEDDALLKMYIDAAVSYAESYQHIPEGSYSSGGMPPTTQQAVIMLASHFYESRDGSTGGFFADNVQAGEQVFKTVNLLLRLDRDWKV